MGDIWGDTFGQSGALLCWGLLRPLQVIEEVLGATAAGTLSKIVPIALLQAVSTTKVTSSAPGASPGPKRRGNQTWIAALTLPVVNGTERRRVPIAS
jgi:hypothetical protein